MLTPTEIQERKDAMLKAEMDAGVESFIWMSFCDTNKPQGQRFLGVIITKAYGMTHAMIKTHDLGINPGGEIQSYILNPGQEIDLKYVDRLMQKPELEAAGF